MDRHSPGETPAPAGCLLRLVWMLAGNLAVYLALATIAMKAAPLPSWLDAVVWLGTGVMLVARWLDITRFHGTTTDGEPATLAHLRRYAARLVLVTLVAWLLAHAIAGSLGAGP